MTVNILPEENYAGAMASTVIPYLAKRMDSGTFERTPEKKIYFEHYTCDLPDAENIILVHGFSEGIGKFKETTYYLLQSGFSVWLLQQREHGKSCRSVPDPSLVYIENYNDLVEDLHYFADQIVRINIDKNGRQPLFLYAHSMGGGIGACCMERYPEDFTKAVLNAPMLEMNAGDTPIWQAELFARFKNLLGRGKDPMPGSAPFSSQPDFEGSCDDSRARYLYWFEKTKEDIANQMCVPAVKTALQFLLLTREATKPENCRKVKANVLLLQAGKDTMVRPGGQEKFIRQISQGKLIRFPHAKHEIYMNTSSELAGYWEIVLNFLKDSKTP